MGLRRLAVGALLIGIGVVSVIGAATWLLVRCEPAAYSRAAVIADAQVAVERAEALERGAASALSQPRSGDGPWIVEIKEEDAAAWIAERLPSWLANRGERWPDAWTLPRVRFADGRVFIGVRGSGGRILGASGELAVEAGEIRIRSARVTIGLVALPARAMAGVITDELARGLIAGDRGVSASTTLDDGRRVSVERVEIHDGRLRFACRTRGAK